MEEEDVGELARRALGKALHGQAADRPGQVSCGNGAALRCHGRRRPVGTAKCGTRIARRRTSGRRPRPSRGRIAEEGAQRTDRAVGLQRQVPPEHQAAGSEPGCPRSRVRRRQRDHDRCDDRASHAARAPRPSSAGRPAEEAPSTSPRSCRSIDRLVDASGTGFFVVARLVPMARTALPSAGRVDGHDRQVDRRHRQRTDVEGTTALPVGSGSPAGTLHAARARSLDLVGGTRKSENTET